ncbi:MAG TPA: hypothetical protein VH253_06150 [Phycisphaerae bacterium]|nr:hypothetical protein [Phycisphaerae bacterium]
MIRTKVCTLAIIALLAGLCVGRDMAAPAQSGLVVGAPELQVTVATPEGGVWMLRDKSSALEVVLGNLTGKPMELYQSWNSWGYFNLTLEWEADGKKGTVTPVGRGWTKNFPSTTTVPAGGVMVRSVDIGGDWTGWPELKDGMKLTLRAVYDSKENGGQGWVGTTESEPVTIGVRDVRTP